MHTTPPSLLGRLRRPGDDPAWERFVLLYTPFIFSLARRFGLDRDAAADVVQDVFVLLARKMVEFTYDPEQSFRAWLRTVVMNRIYESARQRRITLVTGGDPIAIEQRDVAAAFEEAEYHHYITARALEIMQRDFAPTTWKACWELIMTDKSAAEVAKELGMSEGAVYVAKCRVLGRLRTELAGLL